MKNIFQKNFLLTSILGLLATLSFVSHAACASNLNTLYSNAKNSGLSAHVLKAALNSYDWAKTHTKIHNQNVLTVVDYNLPSTAKRLWVLNLKTDKVLMHTLVAHGHNSGLNYATHFSNANNSHETSLGIYETSSNPFYGEHGRALKVRGLESGVNNNAFKRAIEIHGSKYVSPSVAAEYGRIGRSYGCFAVGFNKVQKLINYTKGGSVLFAYATPENNDPVAA